MSENSATTTDVNEQSIEILQQRYQSLHTRKIQAETNLDNAKQRLGDLQREARDKYGTDDVAALRLQLAKMKADNEKRRSEYQQSLDKIESDLADVEQKFAAGGEADNAIEDSA